MQCPRCFFDNPAGTRHCAYCGGELGQQAPAANASGSAQKRQTQLGLPPETGTWQADASTAVDHEDPFQLAATGIRGGAAGTSSTPTGAPAPSAAPPERKPPNKHRATLVDDAPPAIIGELIGCLIVLPDQGPPTTHLLRQGSTRVGRSRSCQLMLDDPRVSGDHAVIQVEDDAVWLLDTSSNGTIVSGERVRMDRAPLADGAVMQFGHTLVVVKLMSSDTLTILRGVER
jgi:hypothetical protein